MEQFAEIESLVITQKREMLEAFTSIETENHYNASTPDGRLVFTADETGGNWLTRNFLKNLRPFFIEIRDTSGAQISDITRPFRWYFHEVQVTNHAGEVVGMVKREFSILTKLYSIFDGNGKKLYSIEGPLFHPWTFNIKSGERPMGKITKKWSGLIKEAFTNEDNFGVIFHKSMSNEKKATILGAVFLIDFMYFEKSDNENGNGIKFNFG